MKKNKYLCTRFANIYPYYNKKFINFMEKIFTLLRGKQLLFFIMTALLIGAVETAKAEGINLTFSTTQGWPEGWTSTSSDFDKWATFDWTGSGDYCIYNSSHWSSSISSTTNVISPIVKISGKEDALTLQAYKNQGVSSWYSNYVTLKIYVSKNKKDWTLARNISYDELDDEFGDKYFTVDGIEAGYYYVLFETNNVALDNIVGFSEVDEAVMVVDANDYNFGLVGNESNSTFTINNVGAKALTGITINSSNDAFTIDNIPSSLSAGEKATFKVNVLSSRVGEQNGTITISAEGQPDYTFNVSAIVMDPLKFYIDFRLSNMPETWNNISSGEEQFEFSTGDDGNAYSTNYLTLLTTSKLVVEEGDKFYFTAKRENESLYLGDKLNIYYKTSEDGNWISTPLIELAASDLSYPDYQVYVIEGAPAGDIYLGFNGKYVHIQEMYGFTDPNMAPSLVLDETVAPEALEKGVQDVELKYNVKAGWNTIALPFAVTDLSVFGEGAKAYELTGYNDGALNFKAAETLKAGSPYVLYVETAAEANGNFKFKGVDITATEPATVGFNDAKFVATYAPMAAGTMTGKYGVVPSTGKIQKGGANATMKGFRAYFELPAGTNGARMIIDGEDVTAISSIITDAENGNAIYNLNGQRVNAATKGVYIINGKKMIIK